MGDGARYTLRALAEALGVPLEGDPDVVVSGVAPLESAGAEHISFLTDGRHVTAARASRAGAFLAAVDAPPLPAPVLRAPAPRLALVRLLELFAAEEPAPTGTHPTAVVEAGAHVDPSASVGAYAVVEPKAVVGAGVRLGPFVYVGRGAEIGAETILHARVVVLDRVRIGRRVIVHAGAVLGADGFGFAPDAGRYRKIPQIGGVVIEDDVEIGANTTIDRSTVGDTVIGRGTKIDNLVQIAHNVHVGADSIIAAQSGVAGSSRLGRGVVLAGQVGVPDHVTIADGVVLAAQSGVVGDLRETGTYLGTPARPVGETRRVWAVAVKLPELARRVRELERRLERLERGAGGTAADGGETPERG
jgi:UDP-3-O-[3-hydroxymyristoyl] glucosamine N-acyltransferase